MRGVGHRTLETKAGRLINKIGGIMLTLTDSAVTKFREFIGPKTDQERGIRIFMTGGG